PANALRAGGERGASGAPAHRAQAAMLIGQMAACLVMLVATSLLARTFARLHSEPLGFEPVRLWVANIVLPNDPFDNGEKRNLFYGTPAERWRALPGVREVGAGTSPPLSSGAPSTVNVGADDAVNAPRISTQDVSREFFRVLGIPIVAGRPFDGRDNAAGART